MSFAVKHAVKKEISGSFRLVSGRRGGGRHAEGSVEEVISLPESDAAPTPSPRPAMERKKSGPKRKVERPSDDSTFLRHLELEAGDCGPGRGRTPFTTTRRLVRHGHGGFGFSVAWTHPPRVERVEAGLPADRAGLRPGDYVIFVEKHNVVTMDEEDILNIIRSCGNQVTLEVYRRPTPNGLVAAPAAAAPPPAASTTCSAATTSASLDLSKRRLHLPQVTFSSETEPLSREEARRQAVYQLLNREQQYAVSLQFGMGRFLLPLADRKDLLTPNDHLTLFQNIEELLRISEDILELLVQEEGDAFVGSIGKVYLKKLALVSSAYRRYLTGLKKADCLLVSKTRSQDFMRMAVEPPVPRRRPDLTQFLHKPLEHFREILKLLQTILHFTKVADDEYPPLARVVQELQVMYRDVAVGSGLMEPEGEGRPLLSLQDLESRMVFTRCKPFVLGSPGRQWIFGGDLSQVEGRAVRPFWALLFSDMLLFTKVSRDRVLFVTEEPLPLLSVTHAYFNIRKKATEFRLLLNGGVEGADSPVAAGCGPELPLSRNPKKNVRRKTMVLRAPTPELKAVWQNLIQRQIIYLNTTRGGTPASSPLDSPDPPTTLSVATLDSISLRRQTPMPEYKSLESSQRQLNELIESKCRLLGKTAISKGSALHLAQWMKGQLGGGPLTPDDEPEPEVWSPETLRRRSEQLQMVSTIRNESRCEEIEFSDTERSISRCTERSHSQSTSDSQVTVRSGGGECRVTVCRQCHKTCLANNRLLSPQPTLDEDDDNWGSLILMGMTTLGAAVTLGSCVTNDPFSPTDVPMISVLPPTPDTLPRSSSFQWDDCNTSIGLESPYRNPSSQQNQNPRLSEYQKKYSEEDDDDDDDDSTENSLQGDQNHPYKCLSSTGGLKRFGTMASLEILEGDDNNGAKGSDSDNGEEWDSDEDKQIQETDDEHARVETVTQSFRGWTARAGSYVAEKMSFFERFGEDSRAVAFFDRYLRPTIENQMNQGESPPDQTTSSVGDDECETSAATSGEDVWGTPTSGGEFDDDIAFSTATESTSPPGEAQLLSPPGSSLSLSSFRDDETELMMDELLATPPLVLARCFPARRRLEPLPEEEDTDSPTSPQSPCSLHEETPSPEQQAGQRSWRCC